MAKTYNGGNIAYWLMNQLSADYVKVLGRIERGTQGFYVDRFQIAYLIALDCVIADIDKELLTITDKGRDALEFFVSEG